MRTLTLSILLIFIFCSCASMKPHPRPWTKGEKAAAGFFIIAHTADWYTTERALDNPDEWERSPLLSKNPDDTELAIYFPLTGIIALTLGHWYPELRLPLLLPYGAINACWAIHNSKLD